MFNTFVSMFKNWDGYRRSCFQLNRFSDRELADLGIVRAEIPRIVREKAAHSR